MTGKTSNRLKTYLKDFWEYYNSSPALQKVLQMLNGGGASGHKYNIEQYDIVLFMKEVLEEKLQKISRIFDIEKLQSVKADNDYIRSYYFKNKIPYSILHTKQNFVHMGISRDGVFKEEDLRAHAKFVDKYITEHKAKEILELATGRGANSLWLARKHPNSKFYGVDLSEGQISFAQNGAEKCANFQAELGDFHKLTRFEDNTFDIVFIVEALCHSNETEKVIHEVKRVLKEDGHFIIFDGYLGSKSLSDEEEVAAKITERGMAVAEFLKYDNFKNLAGSAGLHLVEEENLSQFVIPTMRRFERLAEKFFRRPLRGKLISRLLPQEFTYNSVSGMLMPVLFKMDVFEYWVTVFENKNTLQ